MSDGAAVLLLAGLLVLAACTATPRIADALLLALLLAALVCGVAGVTLLGRA